MKRTLKVYKYDVPIVDCFTLQLPADARPLHVDVQDGSVRMWVLLDVKELGHCVLRKFRFAGTGHEIILAEDEAVCHISTFFMNGGALVFHLFEVVKA